VWLVGWLVGWLAFIGKQSLGSSFDLFPTANGILVCRVTTWKQKNSGRNEVAVVVCFIIFLVFLIAAAVHHHI